MARTRVFGLMPRRPTSSRMLGRAGFRWALPPPVRCLRGAVNCHRIGIGLCASTCRCIAFTLILYYYTSTLGQAVSRAHDCLQRMGGPTVVAAVPGGSTNEAFGLVISSYAPGVVALLKYGKDSQHVSAGVDAAITACNGSASPLRGVSRG
jgi:hypothetical protein